MSWSRYDIFLGINSATLEESLRISPVLNKVIYVKIDGIILSEDLIIDGRREFIYRMKLTRGKHLLEVKAQGWMQVSDLGIAMKQEQGLRQNIPISPHLANSAVNKIKDDLDHYMLEFTIWE